MRPFSTIVFDSHLNKQSVVGLWTQIKSRQIEILLASAFKIMFCFSAGVSLIQVSADRDPNFPAVDNIDALLSEPSMMTLPRANLIFQAPLTLFIIPYILASPLITVFSPSLSVRRANPTTNEMITVPKLDLATDKVLHDFTEQALHYGPVTNTWDRATLITLLSNTPVGWLIPAGCAPQVRPDQIDDGVDNSRRFVSCVFRNPPAAYLQAYDTATTSTGQAAVNFTTQDPFAGAGGADASVPTDQYVWTIAFVPYSASNVKNGALVNAAGTGGGIYTADGANTVGSEGVSYAPSIGANVQSFAMLDALNNILSGSITRSFIQFETGAITVAASVPSTASVYYFNRTTLSATYLTALVLLLVISILSLFALVADGEPSATKFSAMLAATRSTQLLPVADAVRTNPERVGWARLLFGEVPICRGRELV
ncbi:hypothetical protein B0H17DRAFT_1127267 [Mycena rosella]|uniref:Uncharacterized protein n=1 Tax=Mycena rosella TaxID=1033263 RepID=A0AAD7GRG9_MYCRO|nr:hypothetical protein B0H17DRAFT_1127267 [Mycena rosella]